MARGAISPSSASAQSPNFRSPLSLPNLLYFSSVLLSLYSLRILRNVKISLLLCKHIQFGVQQCWQLAWDEWKPPGMLIVATFPVPFLIFNVFLSSSISLEIFMGKSNHPATDLANSQCPSTCSALGIAISPNAALDFPKPFRVTLCCKFTNSVKI